MKKLLRKFLRKLYYFAFPEIPNKEAFICSMGNNSKIYNQAIIYNPSGDKNNIVIGENSHIAGNLSVCSNAGKIVIGDNSFVGENSRIWSAKSIIIGNRVQIAHGCNIFDNNIHSLVPEERHKEYLNNISVGFKKIFDLHESDLIIEDDVWIGAGSFILKGVRIGQGAIVGAGSVVVKDVESNTVVKGNPAVFLKRLK